VGEATRAPPHSYHHDLQFIKSQDSTVGPNKSKSEARSEQLRTFANLVSEGWSLYGQRYGGMQYHVTKNTL